MVRAVCASNNHIAGPLTCRPVDSKERPSASALRASGRLICERDWLLFQLLAGKADGAPLRGRKGCLSKHTEHCRRCCSAICVCAYPLQHAPPRLLRTSALIGGSRHLLLAQLHHAGQECSQLRPAPIASQPTAHAPGHLLQEGQGRRAVMQATALRHHKGPNRMAAGVCYGAKQTRWLQSSAPRAQSRTAGQCAGARALYLRHP